MWISTPFPREDNEYLQQHSIGLILNHMLRFCQFYRTTRWSWWTSIYVWIQPRCRCASYLAYGWLSKAAIVLQTLGYIILHKRALRGGLPGNQNLFHFFSLFLLGTITKGIILRFNRASEWFGHANFNLFGILDMNTSNTRNTITSVHSSSAGRFWDFGSMIPGHNDGFNPNQSGNKGFDRTPFK